MKSEIKKNLLVGQFIFLAIVVGGSVLLYWLFAPSYYSYQKAKLIRTAYEDLKEMDFSMLNDSDVAVFQQYESEDLLFTIADEAFQPLYVSWPDDSGRQVYRHVILHKDGFSPNPEVINRETRNPLAVKLLGLVEQDGKIYYVNIREKVYSVDKFYGYTGKYLAVVFVVGLAVGIPAFNFLSDRAIRQMEKMEKAVVFPEAADEGAADLPDRIRREVVADISHELKTPLAIISSQVEMLQCMGDQVDRKYYYDSIVEEVARMSDMVNNLMDLSLMEHQIQKMERQEMDLADTMEYICVKYQALFQQSHIREEFSLEPDCKVFGNAYYLERAIDNYMMNALSHTAQGHCIQIRMYCRDGRVWVEVCNQGERIEPELMEEIWQGYVMKRSRQDETKQRHMGMGLYLVRRIIQLHEGQYGVENQEKGVKFWFNIPEIKG